MKEPLIFISVSVEKELPKEKECYFTGAGECFWDGKIWTYEKYDRETDEYYIERAYPAYWLKEFSLPELMEEQLDWVDKNYFKVDQDSYVLKYSNRPFGEAKRYTYKELVNDFLTQKGIIEESGPDWDALKDFPNKAF